MATNYILAASKQNIYSSGCSKERINLVCPENHKIAIKRLFYGIKNDARCSGQGRYHSVDCCQPTHTDCLVVDDRKYPVLNMLCSGQRGCDVPATSIQSGQACYSKGYGNMTDYMSVIHDCIPDDDIIPLCSNTHKRGKHLYLANAKYPLPLDAGNDHCQCLIETGSQVGIDIHALDVIITRTESGNHCYQDIELRDDEGHRKEITCGHPGLYAFRNIYNNDVRSVTFTLNNRAPKAQGYIWIQAEAKGDNDFIEIYCGDEMLKRLGYVNPRHTESRTIDNEESGPTLKPVENGGSTNSSNSGTPNVMSDLMELFIGIGVAVVFIIIIGLTGIIILCVRRSDSKKRPTVQHPPPFPSPIMKNKDNNHSSNTYCHYDYDEDKYCSIKRSPMKMTKYSDMNRNADKKLKEAFSQGMAQNDPSQQNGYVNYLEHVQHLDASQQEPLLKKTETDDSDEVSEDEIIMPQSEFITIGKAIQPRITNEREIVAPTLPQKKKMKNKTVTFSPVAMVTPLPSGSEESVPEDYFDEPKANYLEMYSKTMPNRSPEKVKKIMKVTGSQDDMCLNNVRDTDCENVTEEDLWKAFHIKLSDNMSSDPELNPKKGIELKEMQEDPDYDENPYDNLPYINVGSLRRHNIPENNTKDIYREVLKRNYSHEPTMECIPEQ
ncbi:hypothetical protein ACF0H5_007689 [Mactra antiquata]